MSRTGEGGAYNAHAREEDGSKPGEGVCIKCTHKGRRRAKREKGGAYNAHAKDEDGANQAKG